MSKELKTGFVAVVIVVLFIWGYNYLKGENLLTPNQRHFYVEYNNIQGLKKASSITINGLQVGKVTDITFNSDPEKRGKLVVELLIEDDFEFSKKSIAKIYSASLMGGQSLAIIPSYEGEVAVSGDYLKGEVESDIFSSVGEKLNPLQAKLENVIVSADSLFLGLNQTLDVRARKSLNNSIIDLEFTISDIRKTMKSVNQLLDSSKIGIKNTFDNTRVITKNLAQLSDTLVNANMGEMVKKAQRSLDYVNVLMEGVQNGEGTLGKLVKDDAMYNNLTSMSKELEELIREMKLNPKRFVHFSLFGKRAVPYDPEKNKANEETNN
ncbi:organic solvent ABC transporter substrate-binding protein [Polaribacter pacificus]|uniref:Organic solvent ABC transporter substrate-binding protein n=1 Tax=Polaribacter pacificus TaxID=1775173 RepID=A0A917I039_9FLAO|nr:MlaD family protein [Polaribacter pacificus]GGH00656.1 organic solvent ABC transporter substrate-binding protein [Polaribacter pacificus]